MSARIDRRLVLLARAEALAILEREGEITLDVAMVRLGLATCPTCGSTPCANKSFCAACRRADRAQRMRALASRYRGERRR